MMKKSILVLAVAGLISCGEKNTKDSEAPKLAANEWNAALFYEDQNELGEGAIWNHMTNELWSIDIEGKKFFRLNVSTKKRAVHQLEQRIGTIVPATDGRAVLALQDGIYYYDLDSSKLDLIVSPEAEISNMRFNDGKCDPSGRLWVGSMHLDQIDDAAALYKIDSSGNSIQMLDSVTISNGIAWSADKKTMFYIDTPDGKVRVFDYDDATGTISNERYMMDFSEYGYPDGSTIDAEDNLWVCLWNGGKVLRIDTKTGTISGQIHVPAHNITSCAFGGKNLDSLFITSARVDMRASELDAMPLSGSVFVAVPGVKGVKASFFAN
ncbi:SMP-30/gluconolactonase/LRE family protein [Reichenbachiella agarivorans]|uniref:SMP-30/gluconolactonase/LRE family protein n=1 Tax=Reichenbachiella agarivorans TaxID=2979464 RepID=A0ABY6CN89_9BACT|nr:SMP-30/gluconolactonase/LRE family protein [Reichenbachiella agarivorans]UXP30938.1 SMP-30/gluconolactonase/LRE family protein [Reichenbachiella agarivorans]